MKSPTIEECYSQNGDRGCCLVDEVRHVNDFVSTYDLVEGGTRVFNTGDINLRELTIEMLTTALCDGSYAGIFLEISALHCHLLAVVVAGMFSYHR